MGAVGVAARTAVAAVIGGIASKISGGSFEDGAVSAAFRYLFNDAATEAEEAKLKAQWKACASCHGVDLDELEFMSAEDQEAMAMEVLIVVGTSATGVGLTVKFMRWFRRFANPLKYARWGKLQPYSSSTGRYLPSSSRYTNGEYWLYKSTPILNGAADFSTSLLRTDGVKS